MLLSLSTVVGGPLATLKFASDFLTLIFSLPLDRLYKPLSFDFLELQLLCEPLGVVLVLEVVHTLRAHRITPLGRRSQLLLQAERAEQLCEARDVGVAASCWLGRGGKFYRSPR